MELDAETSEKDCLEKDDVGVKTHKHKRTHKRQNKVKMERQIYMPPALKNTGKKTSASLMLNSVFFCCISMYSGKHSLNV